MLAWGLRYGWTRIKQVAQREAAKVLAEYESLLHAHRHMERTTYTVSHDGGMADLVVSTSAIDITAIMASLTERAIELQRAGDPRSLDELRTDLAVDRLLGQDVATPATQAPVSPATATPATGEAAAEATGTPDTSSADTSWAGSSDAASSSTTDAAPARTATAPNAAPASAAAPSDSSASDAPSVVAGARGGCGGVGLAGDVPPVSGLNPAVGVQVVIHCTYAEAEALATGRICTGGELEGYGILPQDALAMAFRRAKFRYRLTDRSPVSDPARHDPSPGLDQHVRDRDRRCRFPGCTARVAHCDLDHRASRVPRRRHHRGQHRGAVPPAPSPQTPRRLAGVPD